MICFEPNSNDDWTKWASNLTKKEFPLVPPIPIYNKPKKLQYLWISDRSRWTTGTVCRY
jgi:hypothetical protein